MPTLRSRNYMWEKRTSPPVPPEERTPADPGRESRESAGATDGPELAILRPRRRYNGESPMPTNKFVGWMSNRP